MADPSAPGEGLEPLLRRLSEHEDRIRELESPSGTQRAATVWNMPIVGMQTAQASPIALAPGFQTYVSIALPVPSGRTRMQVLAIGTAAVLDQTTGGATSSAGRLVIDGVVSRNFPAAKDAGASLVNNVIQATAIQAVDVTRRTSILVEFQLQPLNAAAFPSHVQNFAQLLALGGSTIT